jgi:hypothetical protein
VTLDALDQPKIIDDPKWSKSRDNRTIQLRIEAIGKLNDRRIEARNNRDKIALRQIATEYEEMGMPRMAGEVRAEAKAIRRVKQ